MFTLLIFNWHHHPAEAATVHVTWTTQVIEMLLIKVRQAVYNQEEKPYKASSSYWD